MKSNLEILCGSCTFSSRNYVTLVKHISKFHPGKPPHICMKEYCWERFDSVTELIVHIKNSHRGEGLFSCLNPRCDQLFIERTAARLHIRDFHPDLAKPNLRILPVRELMEPSEIIDLTERTEQRKESDVDLFKEMINSTQSYYESMRFLVSSNLLPKKKLKLSSSLKLKLLKKDRTKSSEIFILMQLMTSSLRKKLKREKPLKKAPNLDILDDSVSWSSSLTDDDVLEEWYMAL